MNWDFWAFDHINALAGRVAWLDVFGRLLAVYGLLMALLIIIAVVWWPRTDGRLLRQYLGALLAAGILCAVLFGVTALLTQHLLHHELRARPANARWVTALITPQTRWNFPAWSVLVIIAAALPTYWIARRVSYLLGLLGFATALALVFVGANFPLDGLVGVLVGLVIGHTAVVISGMTPTRPARSPWMGVLGIWIAVGVAGVMMAFTMKPASTAGDSTTVPKIADTIRLKPPPSVQQDIRRAVQPAATGIDAATNGHIVVAHLRLLVPASTNPQQVVELARRGANAAFDGWRELSLLTISVGEGSFDGKAGKLGTLYTATVDRREWPVNGFTAHQALPGKKFYSVRFYQQRAGGARQRADSPDRR